MCDLIGDLNASQLQLKAKGFALSPRMNYSALPNLLISPGPSMMNMKGMIMGSAAMEMKANRLTSSRWDAGSPPSRES